MTCTFAAHGILDNFKISLVVLSPNTTASHEITYTNTIIVILLIELLQSTTFITGKTSLPSLLLSMKFIF